MTNPDLDALQPYSAQEVLERRGLKPYFIGLTSDCPLSRFRLGPITLHQESHSIVRDAAGNPINDGETTKVRHHDGKVENLALEDVKHIASRAMKTAIRVIPLPDLRNANGDVQTGRRRAHGIKMYQPEAGYAPAAGDLLLSDFVFILAAEEEGRYLNRKPPTLTTKGDVTLPDFLQPDKAPRKKAAARPPAKKSPPADPAPASPKAESPEPVGSASAKPTGALNLGANPAG